MGQGMKRIVIIASLVSLSGCASFSNKVYSAYCRKQAGTIPGTTEHSNCIEITRRSDKLQAQSDILDGVLVGAAVAGAVAASRSDSSLTPSPSPTQPAPQRRPTTSICPDGSYVSGGSCRIAPDGTYVGGRPSIAPNGSYVGGRPRLAPDGSYVGGSGPVTLCPDGSYVSGRCVLTPSGKYVGSN